MEGAGLSINCVQEEEDTILLTVYGKVTRIFIRKKINSWMNKSTCYRPANKNNLGNDATGAQELDIQISCLQDIDICSYLSV